MEMAELEFLNVDSSNKEDDMTMSSSYTSGYGDGNGQGGADNTLGYWFLNQSKHPMAIFFHLLFKALALFIYIFGSWVTTNFIFTFVLCIIFLAFDFWTVKNISGRLLVGLRWWSSVKEDGSNDWFFESVKDMGEISAFDSRIFWGSLYVTTGIWGLLLVIGMLRLKFEYLPIVIAALAMSMANIVGYVRCSTDAKNKMKNMMEQGMRQTG